MRENTRHVGIKRNTTYTRLELIKLKEINFLEHLSMRSLYTTNWKTQVQKRGKYKINLQYIGWV